MEPHLKLWLEQDGRLALSDYRARLLRLVRETGSLAHAAALMGLSYRRAWGKVRELEQNLGLPLVQSDAGGAGGGRSRLTPEAEALLARYEAFARDLDDAARTLHERYFRDLPAGEARSRKGAEQVEPVANDAVDAPGGEP